MEKFEQSLCEHGYCVMDLMGHDLKVTVNTSHTTLFVMCSQGSIDLEVNMERLRLEANMYLIYTNLQFLNRKNVSPDFRARALLVNDKLALASTAGIKGDIIHALMCFPVSQIEDPKVWNLLDSILNNVETYAKLPTLSHEHEVMGSLLRSIVLVLGETIQVTKMSTSNIVYSKADTYFRRFISMVNDNVQTEHEVAFYAEKLNLSSKYLSEICKNKSGRKAKEMISTILVNQIKHDILESNESIKGIANKYGFSDQSSMGKFFHKMTGVSPVKFKQIAK